MGDSEIMWGMAWNFNDDWYFRFALAQLIDLGIMSHETSLPSDTLSRRRRLVGANI